jgi:uncharacterized membrane protein
MAPIRETIEIARSPEDVFAYLDDLTRHTEWQDQLQSVRVVTDGATHVGTRALETRRLGRRTMSATYEITEHDPPRSFAFRALDGPVRPVGRGTVEPAGDGRSRVSVELDFEGHGFGKLLLPLARRQAAKQVPKDQQRLKERLESGVT